METKGYALRVGTGESFWLGARKLTVWNAFALCYFQVLFQRLIYSFFFFSPFFPPNVIGYISPAPLPQVDNRKQTRPGLGQGYTAALNTLVLKVPKSQS